MTSASQKPHPVWVVAVERGLQGLCTAVSAIGAVSLAGMFALVLAAVVMRYVWSRPRERNEKGKKQRKNDKTGKKRNTG